MEELEATVVAVSDYVTANDAEEWLNAVCDAYDRSGEDWDTFRANLDQNAESSFASEVRETFVRFMEDEVSDRWDVLRRMSEERDNLPRQYEDLVEQKAAEQGGPETAAEEADDDYEDVNAGHFLDESTGLYYDTTGERYLRDSGGNDVQLQWVGDSNAYWVNVDGTDYWYDENFAPYGSGAEEAAPDEADAADESYVEPYEAEETPVEEPAEAIARVEAEVSASLAGDRADLVERAGGRELFDQLVAQVLRERIAA